MTSDAIGFVAEGAADNAVSTVKLLRDSGQKMDPLSMLGTVETILTQVNRIIEFVDAATPTQRSARPFKRGCKCWKRL